MTAPKVIWISQGKKRDGSTRRRPYYLYETYEERSRAMKTALKYKKRNKSKYFIIEREEGFWIPIKKFDLYLTRTVVL